MNLDAVIIVFAWYLVGAVLFKGWMCSLRFTEAKSSQIGMLWPAFVVNLLYFAIVRFLQDRKGNSKDVPE